MQVRFFLDGQSREVPKGTKVSAAIFLTERALHSRDSEVSSQPRGMFCGIGCCYECLVNIDGVPKQRSCLVEVAPGMEIERDLK
ncbi:(2Fe-2S)-binding protein [Corynebacterium hadale]|uniref:Proline dehydrogenase n=2 Tax=Corynebacterium hadale TaxID=2026255 RepID=A0A269PBJ4_9CORY|nr:(2Fe-2S)-binding protein [Corynebacterium hadale]PAJ69068.1 hypothetical protein CIG21_09435 [Corynebacterium hadale]